VLVASVETFGDKVNVLAPFFLRSFKKKRFTPEGFRGLKFCCGINDKYSISFPLKIVYDNKND
jgi:hypothetical protein